jgi:hypothetical protein
MALNEAAVDLGLLPQLLLELYASDTNRSGLSWKKLALIVPQSNVG